MSKELAGRTYGRALRSFPIMALLKLATPIVRSVITTPMPKA